MKRIDIYTIDVGGGHIAPSEALKDAFTELGYKDLDVRIINVGTDLGARFLRLVYKAYWSLALRYPPLVNTFYRSSDNPYLMTIIDRLFGISILPRFLYHLEKEKPDLVLSTYFTFTHYLEMLKRSHLLDAISVAINPEPFDAHYMWFSHAFDMNLVFSQKSHDEIVEKGISPRKVKTFQFPIKSSYVKRTEPKSAIRQALDIPVKPFTFLFVFGAEGQGPVKKYLDALMETDLPAQAVVICGKNRELFQQMERLSGRTRKGFHLVVRGFVNNLADYIAASDVVVGKSGPNQVFETMIQERPLIISSFLANERQTTDWVRRNGLGWLCRTPDQFVRLASRLVANPQILEKRAANIRRLGIKSGAPEICKFLYELIEKREKEPPAPEVGLRRVRSFVERLTEQK